MDATNDSGYTITDTLDTSSSSLPKINEIINGKYKIVRKIAQGGMGMIYEAWDTMLDKKIAIKMIQCDTNNSVAIKRFEREIEACYQLSHPNVIKIYDWGMYKKNPYMVMDYIDGISITDYVKKNDPAYGTSNKRNYNLCVKLIAKIAHALEYVHQHKIYHRDIKPSNILVCEDGTPILIDFGIIKSEENSSITKTTEIVGTCNYMSPEQIEGKYNTIDNRSDVYSLGIVLYELVTEQVAFKGSMLSILQKIATEYPPNPTSIRSDIPLGLEKIIIDSIKKNREYRYQSAEKFANALEKYLDNRHSRETLRYYRQTSRIQKYNKYHKQNKETKQSKQSKQPGKLSIWFSQLKNKIKTLLNSFKKESNNDESMLENSEHVQKPTRRYIQKDDELATEIRTGIVQEFDSEHVQKPTRRYIQKDDELATEIRTGIVQEFDSEHVQKPTRRYIQKMEQDQ